MTKPHLYHATDHASLYLGDCLEVLRGLPDNSVDSIVTDPPAGIAFMQADWDKDKGGRLEWIAWLASVMREAKRALKPGGHALVWSIPRTQHWTATAIEEAGFEIRDTISHIFGSGFPKNMDVSKAIDKHLGAERPVVGEAPQAGAKFKQAADLIDNGGFNDPSRTSYPITAAATEEAKRWEGHGTALKPATENWILARKPIGEKTVAANVLKWGTGAIHIGACRVGDEVLPAQTAGQARVGTFEREAMYTPERVGRWPANLLLSHSPMCEEDACAYSCPVREMDEQSGISKSSDRIRCNSGSAQSVAKGRDKPHEGHGYADAGGASRYFQVFHYFPKPSTREKERGLEEMPTLTVNDGRDTPIDNPYQRGETKRRNSHPTVKSLALMGWLVRLITPPGGVVLDCFMGSGSTGCAAVRDGFRFVGIEMSPEYIEIAKRRIEAWGKEVNQCHESEQSSPNTGQTKS